MHGAAGQGQEETVRILLNDGVDVNASDGTKIGTALVVASRYGYHSITELLLEAGANVNAASDHYGSAFRVALQMLLENRADVNAQGGNHGSALNVASRRGLIETMEVLLQHGADPYVQEWGGNALHVG